MPEQGVSFMILLMFGIAIAFASICLFLGYTQGSFPFVYLGMFSFLLIGLFLFSEGISIQTGTQEVPIGSHNFIVTYDVHTTVNDPVINLLANTFFYIPIAGVLLSTFFALRG